MRYRLLLVNRFRAFTLIELSIVVMVLALLAAAAMRYANSVSDANAIAATNATLDAIDTAMWNYRVAFGRLPCPADLTLAENTANFGMEVGYSTNMGDGTCTGYNYINSSTDPDATGGSDPGAPDPNYDSTTSSQVVEGAVPTKTLRLPDRYAYDAWGNKIFYAVDKRITLNNGFLIYPISNAVIGAVVVKKTATDTLANALTYKAIYALISTGHNGHGGFARNLNATAIRASAGSTNTDELNNCHCDSNAGTGSTPFNRIFVQKLKTFDPTSFTDNFDDIVRFKLRSDLASTSELQ